MRDIYLIIKIKNAYIKIKLRELRLYNEKLYKKKVFKRERGQKSLNRKEREINPTYITYRKLKKIKKNKKSRRDIYSLRG